MVIQTGTYECTRLTFTVIASSSYDDMLDNVSLKLPRLMMVAGYRIVFEVNMSTRYLMHCLMFISNLTIKMVKEELGAASKSRSQILRLTQVRIG